MHWEFLNLISLPVDRLITYDFDSTACWQNYRTYWRWIFLLLIGLWDITLWNLCLLAERWNFELWIIKSLNFEIPAFWQNTESLNIEFLPSGRTLNHWTLNFCLLAANEHWTLNFCLLAKQWITGLRIAAFWETMNIELEFLPFGRQ